MLQSDFSSRCSIFHRNPWKKNPLPHRDRCRGGWVFFKALYSLIFPIIHFLRSDLLFGTVRARICSQPVLLRCALGSILLADPLLSHVPPLFPSNFPLFGGWRQHASRSGVGGPKFGRRQYIKWSSVVADDGPGWYTKPGWNVPLSILSLAISCIGSLHQTNLWSCNRDGGFGDLLSI